MLHEDAKDQNLIKNLKNLRFSTTFRPFMEVVNLGFCSQIDPLQRFVYYRIFRYICQRVSRTSKIPTPKSKLQLATKKLPHGHPPYEMGTICAAACKAHDSGHPLFFCPLLCSRLPVYPPVAFNVRPPTVRVCFH